MPSPPPIPLFRPDIGDRERAAADRALVAGRLTAGPEVERFEHELAARCGRAHGVCVSSGGAALELVLWALGLAPGDEVLVASFGSSAAASAVLRAGAVPIAVDAARPSWTVDLSAADALVTPRTRGVIAVDVHGVAVEPAPAKDFAARHGLWLVVDAAAGLGAVTAAGSPAGACGVAATLSFHPRHVVTCGEGGAVVTDDPALALALRELRDHRGGAATSPAGVGTSARCSEVTAAIGAAQLGRLDAMLAERALLGKGYRQRLAPLSKVCEISWQQPVSSAIHAYPSFAVEIPGVDRGQVIGALGARGIECAAAGSPLHRRPGAPRSLLSLCPVAGALGAHALALPLYIGMRSGELDRVVAALTEVLA